MEGGQGGLSILQPGASSNVATLSNPVQLQSSVRGGDDQFILITLRFVGTTREGNN